MVLKASLFRSNGYTKTVPVMGTREKQYSSTVYQKAKIKHNRLNVGRIALERLVGALINCSLLQSGGGVA